jgi:hypothetical protein
MNLAFEEYLLTLRRDFEHAVKSYGMGPTALLPLRREACCDLGCIAHENLLLGRVWTREPLSNDKHANLYTTEATKVRL